MTTEAAPALNTSGGLPGGKDKLRQVSEKLDLCIARRARSGADVAAFLEKQVTPCG